MWHPPSEPTATSTFRINKVKKKKVPQKDMLKRKLSASVRGIGGVVLPSLNEDCLPVLEDVPKSALFLSLTPAISPHTTPFMQELYDHSDIVNTIENISKPSKNLNEPICRNNGCTEKEFSILSSKSDDNKSSNTSRLSSGHAASNCAETPKPKRLAIGEEDAAIIESPLIDNVPCAPSVEAGLPLQRCPERSVAPEECDEYATGRERAEIPLPPGDVCTSDTFRSDETHDPETDRYEVEKILGHKDSRDKTFYRVKWKGYRRATWEPAVNLDDCAEVLEAYQATILQSSKMEA
ncbi:M-phase phosphoprotein 8 [Didymella keratinophila]|nr:M-phase phosphoprotein 8 [Didymella keratinophila]